MGSYGLYLLILLPTPYNGKLCIDTPKFVFLETVVVVLQKIKLCKGQTWCYIRNFLYLHDDFF